MYRLFKNLIPIFIAFFIQSAYAQTPVNQALIGQNYWLNVGQVWNQVTNMKTEIMRVGGIEFNSNYYGTTWYDATLDNIENAGAEPMIQISEQWSDTQRKALLQHFVDNNRDIKYFAIGNEPDHNNRVPDVNTIIEYYNRIGPQIREYYPNAILIGPCWANFYESFITSKYFPFIEGTKNTKDKNGKYILNVFSFHTYASAFASGGVPIFDLATFENRMNILLPKITEVNTTRPANEKLSWSVTELHTTYNNDSINVGGKVYAVPATHKTYSFYAGQYFAQLYGYAMRNGAFGMMPWSLIEGAVNRNFGDLGIFDHDLSPRSTAYHTSMLSTNLKEKGVSATSSKTDVEVVAMDDNTGTTVMIMNTQGNAYNYTLSLSTTANPTNDLVVKVDAQTNVEQIGQIAKESTVLLVFDANGALVKRVTYSKLDADAKRAPTEELFTPTNSTVHQLPGLIEAEDFFTQAGLQVEPTQDTSGVENLGYTTAGDFANYKVDAKYSGIYIIEFRVASNASGASFSFSADDNILLDQINVESTLGWQNWTTLSSEIYLEAGTHTLAFNVIQAGFNLNWINLKYKSIDPVVSFSTLTDGQVLQEGSPLSVSVLAEHPAGIASVDLFLDDKFIRKESIATYDWADDTLQNLPAGIYSLTAVAISINGDISETSIDFEIAATQIELPQVSFINLADGFSFEEGTPFDVHVEATHPAGIQYVNLYIDDILLRKEAAAPFDWYDNALDSLGVGIHTLKAIATSISGIEAEVSLDIEVLPAEIIVPISPLTGLTIATQFIQFNWTADKAPSLIEFKVVSAQGNVVKEFNEQNVHIGYNNIWIKDYHQLSVGSYIISIIQNGSIIQTISFTKQ